MSCLRSWRSLVARLIGCSSSLSGTLAEMIGLLQSHFGIGSMRDRGHGRTMKQRKTLRSLIAQSRYIVAPGAFDTLTARLVQLAGFEAVYLTGGGYSRANGYPDLGLLTLTEITRWIGLTAEAVDIPVIADADTGYGNALNVVRTVREFEKAGAAAFHLEDQLAPKKCGHYEGKQLVSAEEMIGKIKAAVDTRQDGDIVIIARSDARAVEGLDAAIERVNRYIEAGADMGFVEAPQTAGELAQVGKRVTPAVANIFEGGKTPVAPGRRTGADGLPARHLSVTDAARRDPRHQGNTRGAQARRRHQGDREPARDIHGPRGCSRFPALARDRREIFEEHLTPAHARESGHPSSWLWVPAFVGTRGCRASRYARRRTFSFGWNVGASLRTIASAASTAASSMWRCVTIRRDLGLQAPHLRPAPSSAAIQAFASPVVWPTSIITMLLSTCGSESCGSIACSPSARCFARR